MLTILSFTFFFIYMMLMCVLYYNFLKWPSQRQSFPLLDSERAGLVEQISWELISQNTRRTQLTPCKAFWALPTLQNNTAISDQRREEKRPFFPFPQEQQMLQQSESTKVSFIP